MSIVRVGLGENVDYGQGWEAIFGKGSKGKPAKTARPSKASAAKKKTKHSKKKK